MLRDMSVMHPAAKMLVDLSAAQDIEAGDGTTSVVVIAGSLLGAADRLLAKGKSFGIVNAALVILIVFRHSSNHDLRSISTGCCSCSSNASRHVTPHISLGSRNLVLGCLYLPIVKDCLSAFRSPGPYGGGRCAKNH